jgi:hypothetical protein
MRTMITRLIALTILLLAVMPVLAQESGEQGQFWVQAFEDRNGNGTHDPGEPFLTSGVSVDLLNADGVVMASGTLDDAPYATQGYLGFLYLAPGNYTAVINSPGLTPTTPDRVDVTITGEAALVRVSFGAQRAAASEPAATNAVTTLVDPQVARLALAGFGAMVVIGVMTAIGVVVYLLVLRPRRPAATPPTATRTTTGSMRAVRVDETGEVRQTSEWERK